MRGLMRDEAEAHAPTYRFEGQDVRFVGTLEGPEWVALDVCLALGMQNNRAALRRVPKDEKGFAFVETNGGRQRMRTVKEPGLYRLIMTSRKPEAKRFSRWVVHEVLPNRRRAGAQKQLSLFGIFPKKS
jgi:prophage antirepressor-like protein